jgi:hypothetical protein
VKDLAQDDSAAVVFDAARKTLGQVNASVNNAAWSPSAIFHAINLDIRV